jgi:hypothetical protein
MNISIILLFTATVLCGHGWAIIAYSGYAVPRGWRVGTWYAAEFSWLQGIAYVAIIGSLIFGYLAFGWWAPIVVVVIGNIVTRILLATARESAQIIAPIVVFFLGILSIVLWTILPGGS